jgi:hypothetical protein
MKMAKAKRKLWVCPLCNVGKLGLQRPRKDHVIRYCLPCSEKTGRFVERFAPADQTKKAKAVAKTNANADAKPRKTVRDWMKTSRYEYTIDGVTYNVMLGASSMCRSSGWKYPNRLKKLWKRTQSDADRKNDKYTIRFQRRSSGTGSTGRATPNRPTTCWVRVTLCATYMDLSLVCVLHELCHVDQDKVEKVNGVRRAHDLAFNVKQYEMAKRFWGYPTHPEDAGWSVGKGYAPTRHLEEWLRIEIEKRNPKVMQWLEDNCKF